MIAMAREPSADCSHLVLFAIRGGLSNRYLRNPWIGEPSADNTVSAIFSSVGE